MVHPLYAKFRTNRKEETDGKWFTLDVGMNEKNPRVLLSRFDSMTVQARSTTSTWARNLGISEVEENNIVRQEELERKLEVRIFVDVSLKDWENMTTENGEDIPFSKQAAYAFYDQEGMHDVLRMCSRMAEKRDNYLFYKREEEAKN